MGRRISKPRLIHYTGAQGAMEVFVEGKPAIAEEVTTWRILKKYNP